MRMIPPALAVKARRDAHDHGRSRDPEQLHEITVEAAQGCPDRMRPGGTFVTVGVALLRTRSSEPERANPAIAAPLTLPSVPPEVRAPAAIDPKRFRSISKATSILC